MVRNATDLGAVDGNTVLHGMTVNFSLTATQKASLDALPIVEAPGPQRINTAKQRGVL